MHKERNAKRALVVIQKDENFQAAQAAAKQQNPAHDPISDKKANEAICNVVATGTALAAEPVVPVELNAPESEVFTYAR